MKTKYSSIHKIKGGYITCKGKSYKQTDLGITAWKSFTLEGAKRKQKLIDEYESKKQK